MMKRIIKITIGLLLLFSAGCIIFVDQTTLDFGSTETTMTFTLTVLGSVEWSIENSEDWVTVDPREGQTTETINVTVDRTDLDIGEYEAVLRIVTGSNIFNQNITVIMTVEEEEFSEETPAWAMPDPAVIALVPEPERIDPGNEIILSASVGNTGTGDAEAAELVFLVEGEEIGREPVDALGPGEDVEIRTTWVADLPGRYEVTAQLELGLDGIDKDLENNQQTATVRVSGEENPQPELEMNIELDVTMLNAGDSATVTLHVSNPSLADASNIPVGFYIDGEQMSEETIEYIAAGEEQQFEFPWGEISAGQHVIEFLLDLPDHFYQFEVTRVKSWLVTIPDIITLYDVKAKHKWVSLGPRILSSGPAKDSVGRMDAIAIHPTDSKTIYAGAPLGGVWKTTDGGG